MCLSLKVRVCRVSTVRPGVATPRYQTRRENAAQSAATQNGRVILKEAAIRTMSTGRKDGRVS